MSSIETEAVSAVASAGTWTAGGPEAARSVIGHRIRDTFSLSPLIDALSRPGTAMKAVSMALTVLRYFFYPQFETRFFPRKRPVVNVDHPLDETIPFRPGLVAEYLTFFFLWINTGLFMSRNYGRRGKKAYSRYIDEFKEMYRDCGSVYLRRQSTTKRPPEAANSLFSIIHSLDPHLHCVPSLHILVVVGNWILAERYLRELAGGDFGKRETKALAYVRQEAVRITESVLFVKQHSVNCVGVSLFYLRARFPEFDDARVADFMEELFSYEGAGLENAMGIKDYVYSLYERLWKSYERKGDGDWRRVVFGFLREFKANPPF